ncbi:hypothetical protein IDAT_06405 [Pseudidiomarina atlantica]|uniref:SMP-30/Gluconolactonase/LRE-like region domain-containing protein n=1 Tax=Pseudidiomarina atlantica TaxID=1517416 RepID=A0A094IMC6_9GAMM|nr:SMP-30/gluconolactonase/LRE family protein [Pseudidiomarina atlantica]KFZ28830.1 hypothetical protein IDAT_06405 [Pseudidiomarina atlantica]
MYKLLILLVLSVAISQPAEAQSEHQIDLISAGHRFTEGPLWYDNALWFSDIPASTIYRWQPEGETTVAVRPSSGANGLIVDAEGRLLMAQHQARRIARLNSDGTQTNLASHYQDKRLFAALEAEYDQGMDGMAVAADGTLYVAGPEGIYVYTPAGELVERIELPDFTANVTLVETDRRVLYVTNQTEVFRITLNTTSDNHN